MRIWTILLPAVGLGLLVFLQTKPAFKSSKNVYFALGMLALLCLNGYVAYKEHLVSNELTEIGASIEAIKAEVTSGRTVTAEEAKNRADRLNALSERLAALRRR